MELQQLSPEILLAIITRLPDFGSLYNLLVASPRSWRLFNHEALTITKAILSGADSILPPQIQELIRAVILARSSALPFHSLNEFQLQFLRINLPHPNLTDPSPLMTLGPGSLDLADPLLLPAVLRSVVATARQISVLTYACLESLLSRIRDPAFITYHCYQKGFRYTHRYGTAKKPVPPWEREFAGTPVEMRDAGPPSWVEEMRVMRALWFVQLVGDVRRLATNEGGHVLGWRREEVEIMSRIEPEELADIPVWHHGGREEVRAITEYLAELSRTSHVNPTEGPYYRLPWPAADALVWKPQQLPERQLTWSNSGDLQDCVRQVAQAELSSNHGQDPQVLEGQHRNQMQSLLDSQSPGASFFLHLTTSAYNSPLFGVKFDSFRRLGFGIWDQKRMHLLGLLNGEHPPYRRAEFYFFAWKSILSAKEIASLKAGNPEREDQWRRSRHEAN